MIDLLEKIIGKDFVLTRPEDMAPHLVEWRHLYQGTCACVVKPCSAQQVADILKVALRFKVPVVPQGGNTGLVGGQIPFDPRAIVLCLSRMHTIRSVDATGSFLIADAGCLLHQVQQAAQDINRLFPLRLASEGSCQIGGTIATNAGGIGAMAYGSMRDLVLGLEVVLADGHIWNGLRGLRKDNSGYDLKHLFIGSEGTLGVITAACLKLFPRPRSVTTAMMAVRDPAAAVAVLRLLQERAGPMLTACELLPRFGLELVTTYVAGARDPFRSVSDWYVLADVSSLIDSDPSSSLESWLGEALEAGLIQDGVVACSEQQRAALWALREAMSEVQSRAGGSIKHDVSVAVADIPAFIQQASAAVLALVPGCRPLPFGHLGDGNIHFNVSQPPEMDRGAFLDLWDDMSDVVHRIVVEFSGSVAAEHGIGRLKVPLLARLKPALDMQMMRTLKRAFDPYALLNPGKVLEASEEP